MRYGDEHEVGPGIAPDAGGFLEAVLALADGADFACEADFTGDYRAGDD